MVEDVDAIPENVADCVRNSGVSFLILTGEEVNVEDLQVGQRIPSYVVTEDGPKENVKLWPVYKDGEMCAVVVDRGTEGVALDVQLPGIITASGLDVLALVYDNTTLYYSDGTQLIKGESFIEEDTTRVPITEENEADIVAACELGRVGAIIGGVSD